MCTVWEKQFLSPGRIHGDWIGEVRDSGKDSAQNNRGQHFGNNMHAFNGGAVANATFPVMYAVGEEGRNFALFFDNTYKQRWDFTTSEWKVEASAGDLKAFIIVGEDLPSLRAEYMDITGRPPVRPKKPLAFGSQSTDLTIGPKQMTKSKLCAPINFRRRLNF